MNFFFLYLVYCEIMNKKNDVFEYKGNNYTVYYYEVDGKFYYYSLDDNKNILLNNYVIVSSDYKEIIDNKENNGHFGLIDDTGKEIITCDKKRIYKISDYILLVEPKEPVSKYVKISSSNTNNEEFLDKLVPRTNKITEEINKKMENNGNLLYANPYSEVTIIDIFGNNLVMENYYSYVGKKDDLLVVSTINDNYSIEPFYICFDNDKDYEDNGDKKDKSKKMDDLEDINSVQEELIEEYININKELQQENEKLKKYIMELQKENVELKGENN